MNSIPRLYQRSPSIQHPFSLESQSLHVRGGRRRAFNYEIAAEPNYLRRMSKNH